MGASIAKNVTQNASSGVNNIANSYVTSCTTTVANNQNITASGNCKVDFGTIDVKNTAALSTKCMQSNTTITSMRNQIKNKILSNVTSQTQNLGLPSLSVATNISEAATNLANVVTNTYTQTCINSISSNQSFSCTDNAEVTVNYLNMDNGVQAFQECVQNNISIIDAQNNLESAISQTTAATEENAFAGFFGIFMIIIGIIAIFFINSLNGPIGWLIVAIIICIAIGSLVYGYLASKNGLYPYPKKIN